MSDDSFESLLEKALAFQRSGRSDEFTSMCTEILSRDPGHFGANYLLACDAAERRDADVARAHFEKAMVRQPLHVLCRFQAGLLELVMGDLPACGYLWEPLENTLPDDSYIKCFVQGCLAMALGRFSDAHPLLVKGLSLNKETPVLNVDMQQVLDRLEAIMADPATAESTQATATAGSTLSALNLLHVSKTRH